MFGDIILASIIFSAIFTIFKIFKDEEAPPDQKTERERREREEENESRELQAKIDQILDSRPSLWVKVRGKYPPSLYWPQIGYWREILSKLESAD
mgnify:CR=1 FL=1